MSSSVWPLSLALAASAWLAWGLARRQSAGVRGKPWWRLGSALLGFMAILTAASAFVQLGVAANFERAFADEYRSRETVDERLAQIDRRLALVLFAGVAGGLAIVLALSDASRK